MSKNKWMEVIGKGMTGHAVVYTKIQLKNTRIGDPTSDKDENK